MKKAFTLLMGAAFCTVVTSNAQTSVWKEDFESVTVPALPNGWTQVTKDTTGWKTHTGNLASTSGLGPILAHTTYAVVDDWNPKGKNDTTMLVSPFIDLTGVTGAYVKYSYFFHKAAYSGGSPAESAFVKASTDTGKTWTIIATFDAATSWKTGYTSLEAYNNVNNLQIAISYHDGGSLTQQLVGCAVDDIEVFVPPVRDVKLTTINLPTLYDTTKIAASGMPVKVSVMNYGGDTVKDLEMAYVVDGGTPVTQTFTGLGIAPFSTAELVFSTTLTAIMTTSHSIDVNAMQVNNNTDVNPADNIIQGAFLGASASTNKDCIIEEFTSSTCPPCASFNSYFDPLMESNNANKPGSGLNVIKYQMNWPNPGNDASFNAHGNARKNYYAVGGIPDHYTNGKAGGNGSQAEIDGCKGGLGFAKITGNYSVDNDSMWGEISVTPYFNLTRNYRVFIAIVEKGYWNEKNTTGQREYKHAMRRMFPDGNGYAITSVADNTPVSYKFHAPVVIGEVKQNSFNLWSHPMNTEIIAFVQDPGTGDILQSFSVEAEWPVKVEEMNSALTQVALYPNPAYDMTTMGFHLEKPGEVTLQVVDAVGRISYAASAKLEAGNNEMTINTSVLPAGIYNVKIEAENSVIVKRLSVIK